MSTKSEEQVSLELVEFTPKEAPREQWDLYHEYRKVRQMERRPDDPILPDEFVEKAMKQDDPYGEQSHWFFIGDGKIVSAFSAGVMKPEAPGYENNKHLMWGGGSVRKEYRRNGIGASWLPKVVELLDRWDRQLFSTGTEEDEGHAFLKWLGAEQRFSGAENRLDFTAIDWNMVNSWIEDGPKRAPGTKIELFENRLPDPFLDEYCPVYTALGNMAPREDLDMGDWVSTPETWREAYKRAEELGSVHHTMITRESDGAISGLTEIWYQPAREGYISQDLTGVIPDYRGRGLGKWLKANMLDYIKKNYPKTKWVVTGNAHSNAPMLAINKALGFKEYKAGGEYQISADDLKVKAKAVG